MTTRRSTELRPIDQDPRVRETDGRVAELRAKLGGAQERHREALEQREATKELAVSAVSRNESVEPAMKARAAAQVAIDAAALEIDALQPVVDAAQQAATAARAEAHDRLVKACRAAHRATVAQLDQTLRAAERANRELADFERQAHELLRESSVGLGLLAAEAIVPSLSLREFTPSQGGACRLSSWRVYVAQETGVQLARAS